MDGPSSCWTRWSAELHAAHAEHGELRRVLLRTARVMRCHLRPGGSLIEQFAPLGVEIVKTRLAASGACGIDDERRIVFVDDREPVTRQRFTAAHEIAHLLLETHGGAIAGLDRDRLERLCDDFASELLIGHDRLRAELLARGVPRDPGALLRLCGVYGVGPQAVILALGPQLRDLPVVLLSSTMRGHPARPDVVDFRVDASAGNRRVFVPRHQRLRTLGLHDLARWADSARHGRSCSGEQILSLTPRRVAEPLWPGRACWIAQALGEDPAMIVASIEVEELLSRPRIPLALAA